MALRGNMRFSRKLKAVTSVLVRALKEDDEVIPERKLQRVLSYTRSDAK